jgi:hypothetical protein
MDVFVNKEKCQICGVELNEQNRSKSYKHRCKPCVAKAVKEQRVFEKEMKEGSLDDIIERYSKSDDLSLKEEHQQIARWLRELKKYRKILKVK